ncbi:hypothetical protein BP5796_02603 [Coleophoma crateriformis]|uniref:Uncharacterized protein n=1 Tax=Coleophoma crateriformis TaxID=565419 RepID=A0A3D8T0A8_9HELO|nr:hypothetical protein BP5796_02603 [Coleophoma crateriformis]
MWSFLVLLVAMSAFLKLVSGMVIQHNFLHFKHTIQDHAWGYIILINATPYDWKKVASEHEKPIPDVSKFYKHGNDDWMGRSTVREQWSFLDVVPAGTIATSMFYRYPDEDECKVTYSLQGMDEQSFELRFTHLANYDGVQVHIQYQGTLESLNNPVNSTIKLQNLNRDWTFILGGTGTERPYISTNPPVAWMEATYPTFGNRTLRNICLPGSVNAGQNRGLRDGLTTPSQNAMISRFKQYYTQRQERDILGQLWAGARHISLRPVHPVAPDKAHPIHSLNLGPLQAGEIVYNEMATWKDFDFTDVTDAWVPGQKVVMNGQKLSQIVDNINTFTQTINGELIILNLKDSISDCARGASKRKAVDQVLKHYHDDKDDGVSEVADTMWREIPLCAAKNITFNATETVTLMNELERIEALWRPEGGAMNLPFDLTTVPISTWLGNGNSTVLVTLTEDLTKDLNETMSLRQDVAALNGTTLEGLIPTWGIVHHTRMPTQGGTAGPQGSGEALSKMMVDDIIEFGSREKGLLRTHWVMRADDIREEGHPDWQGAESGLFYGGEGQKALMETLWEYVNTTHYPNTIEVEDFVDPNVAVLCMAINEVLATDAVGQN